MVMQVTIRELLKYMITESDNVACDILIKLAGGTGMIIKYIHNIGINGIYFRYKETDMHADWSAQYSNWCEATEMVHLLELFYLQKCISNTSTTFLDSLMKENTTGQKRIKALLPKGELL
jgi:beta-lactamase class A